MRTLVRFSSFIALLLLNRFSCALLVPREEQRRAGANKGPSSGSQAVLGGGTGLSSIRCYGWGLMLFGSFLSLLTCFAHKPVGAASSKHQDGDD